MQRRPEPALMLDEEQARAYAAADFEAPNTLFLSLLRERLPALAGRGWAADLGCGPGDITLRFARALSGWNVCGVDGSPAMLALAHSALARSVELAKRVRFLRLELPASPPRRFDLVFSNSLLHHLPEPATLWRGLREWAAPGAGVFIMDLARPDSPTAARALVERHASGEPEVLQRDFYNSLLAAWRPEEIVQQLGISGLETLRVESVSDRHLVIHGVLPLPVSGQRATA